MSLGLLKENVGDTAVSISIIVNRKNDLYVQKQVRLYPREYNNTAIFKPCQNISQILNFLDMSWLIQVRVKDLVCSNLYFNCHEVMVGSG